MNHTLLRFYAELNDHLPPGKRAVSFECAFEAGASVGQVIEAQGVPASEVDLILVNGESAEFSRKLRDGDRVSVYPVFEAFDITPVLRVRSSPLRRTRFLAGRGLERLATLLRERGFETFIQDEDSDHGEKRILLTKDPTLLERSDITHGYCVRESDPERQLAEVLQRFDLMRSAARHEPDRLSLER